MSLWSTIKKILLWILAIILIIFFMLLVFPTKKSLNPLFQDIFRNNINSMRDAADTYFTNERMPKNVGDKIRLSLREMLDMHLLLPFTDKNGKSCDLDKSYVEVTKNETEYELRVNLSCSEEEAYIIEHLGCIDRCINCNKKEETEEKPTAGTNPKPSNPVPSVNKKYETQYKLMKTVSEKVLESYVCNSSTIDGKRCKHVSSETLTAKPIPLYSTRKIEKPAKYRMVEEIKYKYLYTKTTTTKKEVPDTSKPIFQKTYKEIGSYKQYVCDGFTYFRDSSTETTYKTGNWKYSYRTVLTYVPTDTYNTKYVYIGMDYEKCSSTCTLKPYYIYEVYTRSTTAVNQTKEELSATCNVVEKNIPIYGLKMTFEGYVTNEVSETLTSEKWSTSSKDSALIKNGYTYTGTKEETERNTVKEYYCTTGKPNGDKCVSEETYVSDYECPTTYSYKNSTCSKIVPKETYTDAVPVYKTINSLTYKWSRSKNEQGWIYTGETRKVEVR